MLCDYIADKEHVHENGRVFFSSQDGKPKGKANNTTL